MSGSLVTIETYPNPVEAEIACAFLRAEGFGAEVANQAMQTAVLGAGNPLVRIELQVPAAQAEAARARLREQRATEAGAAAEEASAASCVRTVGMDRSDWNEREKLAERAYRASVLGPFIPVPFVAWYGLWCTVRALAATEPMRESQRRRLVVAAICSSLFSLLWVALLLVLAWPMAR